MSNREGKSARNERLEKEAAEWLVKRDRGFTPEEQDAFFQWLGRNPQHGDGFADHQKVWKEFDLLAEWLPEHSKEPNPDLLANGLPRRRWNYWWSWTALAASLAVVFLLFSTWDQRSEKTDTITRHFVAGAYEYHVLDDGSEIDMNSGSEVLVDYSEGTRLVKLLAGEVHFSVAKDAERPFVVKAGGMDVRAVGTAFNVLLSVDSMEVLVTEGRVRMERSIQEGDRSDQLNTDPIALDLIPGQRSVVSLEANAPQFETDLLEAEEVKQLLAWKHELLDFEATPLAEAVNEFNRRNDIQLVIADPELGGLSIAASFRSNNVEGFARLLELTADVHVERTSEREIILRKR